MNFCRKFLAVGSICFLTAATLFSFAPCESARAEEDDAEAPGIYANAYILMDGSGAIYAKKNEDTTLYDFGSFSGIVSGLVTAQVCDNLDLPMGFSQGTIDRVPEDSCRMDPPEAAGEAFSVRETMYAMIMGESVPAACQLSEVFGGDEQYIALMNRKAFELGAEHTHFSAVSSDLAPESDPEYTTLSDMMVIFRAAVEHPELKYMIGTESAVLTGYNGTEQRNLTAYSEFMTGIRRLDGMSYSYCCTSKDVRKPEVLFTIVGEGNDSFIAILAGSGKDHLYDDTINLINYGKNLREGMVSEYSYETAAPDTKVRFISETYLYEKDATNATVIGKMAEGRDGVLLASWGEWSRVRVDDFEGYVKGDHLKLVTEDSEKNDPDATGENISEETLTPPGETVTMDPGTSNVAMRQMVMAQRIQEKKRLKTNTYIAIAVAVISILGLYVVHKRKH